MKRREHLLDLTATLRGTLHAETVGQSGRDGLLRLVDGGGVVQLNLHSIQPADSVEEQLRDRDVQQGELPVDDPRRALVEQQPAHQRVVHAVADDQLHRAAELNPVTRREPLSEHH